MSADAESLASTARVSTDAPRPADDESVTLRIPPGLWWRVVVCLAMALVLAFGLLGAIWLLAAPLALLLAAVVLGEALDPLADWFGRRMPRIAAVALVYLLLLALLGGLGWLIVAQLAGQFAQLLLNAPSLIERLQGALGQFDPALSAGLSRALASSAEANLGQLAELPLELASGLLEVVLVIVMSIYWLMASDDLRRFSFSFVPPDLRDEASAVMLEIVETTGGYVQARVLVGLIVAAATCVGLLMLGVEYPLILALLAGCGELIPFVGPLAAAVPALALALLGSPSQALGVLVLYVIVQQVKGHLLMPYVTRRQADIPPLLVLFALLAGGAVGGIVGALVGPPVAGAIRILLIRVAAPAMHRGLSTGRPSARSENREV